VHIRYQSDHGETQTYAGGLLKQAIKQQVIFKKSFNHSLRYSISDSKDK